MVSAHRVWSGQVEECVLACSITRNRWCECLKTLPFKGLLAKIEKTNHCEYIYMFLLLLEPSLLLFCFIVKEKTRVVRPLSVGDVAVQVV